LNKIKCNYKVSLGLIGVISSLVNMEEREIWSTLADETQVCFDRMDKKGIRQSWRWVSFPGTTLRLKITVNAIYSYPENAETKPRRCEIKLDSNQYENFTSDQVEDFLVEKVLLGYDED
jgi:hypothetical protein